MSIQYPVLYSFRRCPYAIRARLAITSSALKVEIREVVLRHKPQQLLQLSAKATVPVLQLENHQVIDESLDIMNWALNQNDPEHWLSNAPLEDVKQLIQTNDSSFKYALDRYKYADRHPEHDQQYYRTQAEQFIQQLEHRLSRQPYLCSRSCSLADIAIFPFIRQFATVDLAWFQSTRYQHVNRWLQQHLESRLFNAVMEKYPAWREGSEPLMFNPTDYFEN